MLSLYSRNWKKKQLAFSCALLSSIVPERSVGAPTFTRATTATVTDWEGVVRTVLSGEARFQGARRVQNLLLNTENMTGSGWAAGPTAGTGTPATCTAGFTAPDGTSTAFRVQANRGASNSSADQSSWGANINVAATMSAVVNSLWIKSNTAGNQNVLLRVSGANASMVVTATPTWQRMSVNAGSGTGTNLFNIGTRGGSTGSDQVIDVLVWHPQMEDVTGQSNQNPSEYVSVGVLSAPYHGANVDGVKYFTTQNGNTVSGNVVTAAAGAAIANSTLLGYLAEEARTNLCLQSTDFTTTWTLNNATVSANSTTAPDGSLVADKIQETATNTGHYIQQTFTKAASALTYTFSIHLKQAERGFAWIQLDDGTNGSGKFFNLATGAVGNPINVGAGFVSVLASTVQTANGFWRVKVTATSTTGTTLRVLVGASSDGVANVYLGTAGSGIYAWGAQLEQGGAFGTSYIPTTTVAVARNADDLEYTVTGNVVDTVGACYAEFLTQATNGSPQAGIIGGFGSAGVQTPLMLNGTPGSGVGIYDGTTVTGTANGSTSTTTVNKAVTAWDSSTSIKRAVANGSAVASGAFDGGVGFSGAFPIGVRQSSWINGTIRNVKIWTRALTDAQMQAITS